MRKQNHIIGSVLTTSDFLGLTFADRDLGRRRFQQSILREYDIRGVVGETLFVEDAQAVGQAFGTLVRQSGGDRVCVCYDGRLSSPEMTVALISGLMETGVHVISIGRGPSPMLYFAEHALDADAGIMVTGSHNPAEYNGFKMVLGHKPFFGDQISELGQLAEQGNFVKGIGSFEEVEFEKMYVDHVLQAYRLDSGLKVAWDAGNGAAGEAMRSLTNQLPGEHILINAVIDGRFPNHHPDPTIPKNLTQLIEAVVSYGCDLGVAFDGDGDRIGVIDRKGRILWGDQLMMLWAEDVLQDRPGATIIADVKASDTLFERIRELGGQPLMCRTGHSLIKTKMVETSAPLAGEMSGHIFFADKNLGFDDALYAAVRLLRYLVNKGEDLADLRDKMPAAINTPELRIPCEEARKFEVVEEVHDRLTKEGANVDDTDGVRVSTDDGWWLLRASNTQEVLVARCEASDEQGLSSLKCALNGQLMLSGIQWNGGSDE